jgi:hypothetical protein
MQTVQIKDAQLVRDIHSKAVLNTDKRGLEEYLMKKEIAKKQQNEQQETKLKLAKLEEEMSEIKSLLQEIANMRKV